MVFDKKTSLLVSNLALGTLLLIIIRSGAAALFLDYYELSYLPWFMGIQAILVVVLSFIHTHVVGKINRQLEVAIICFSLISVLISPFFVDWENYHWGIFIFAIACQSLIDIVLVEISILQTNSLNTDEVRKIQPVINIGATIGAILGGLLSGLLVSFISTQMIVSGSALLVFVMYLIASVIVKNYSKPTTSQPYQQPVVSSKNQASYQLFKNPLTLLFLAFISCFFLASAFIDYQFKATLQATYSANEIFRFLGYFNAIMNIVTLLIQVVLGQWILARLGLVLSLLATPLSMLMGILTFVMIPSVWTIALTQFVEGLSKNSFFKDTIGLVFIPYSIKEQAKLRIMIGGIIPPFSFLCVSVMLLILGNNITFWFVPSLIMIMSGAAIGISLLLYKPYINQLQRALSNRRVRLRPGMKLPSVINEEVDTFIATTLSKNNPVEIAYVLDLIEQHPTHLSASVLSQLLDASNPLIWQRCIELIENHSILVSNNDLKHIILSCRDDEKCIKYLHLARKLKIFDLDNIAAQWLENHDKHKLTAALSYLFVMGTTSQQEKVLDQLDKNMKQNNQYLSAYIDTIGLANIQQYRSQLADFLEGKDINVTQAAIRTCKHMNLTEYSDNIIDKLHDSKYKEYCMDALISFNEHVIDTIQNHLSNDETPQNIRYPLFLVLGRIHHPASVSALIKALEQTDNVFNYRVILARIIKITRSLSLDSNTKVLLERNFDRYIEQCHQENSYILRHLQKPIISDVHRDFVQKEWWQRIKHHQQHIFLWLQLHFPAFDWEKAFLNFSSKDSHHRSNSLELIRQIPETQVIQNIMPILELNPQIIFSQNIPLTAAPDATFTSTWLKTMISWVVKDFEPMLNDTPNNAQECMEKLFFMKSVPMFSSMSGEEILPLAQIFSEIQSEPGDILFEQGDTGDALYLILDGKVNVKLNQKIIATLEKKNSFGEMVMFDPESPRSTTIECVTECRFLIVKHQDFHEVLEEYPEIYRDLLKILSRRLRKLLQQAQIDSEMFT